MTPYEERDQQTAEAMRRELYKAISSRERCGYPPGSPEDSCKRFEIMGMVKMLRLIDQDAMRFWPST